MKKYYLSHVDFSELINVTADPVQIKRARRRMQELGMLSAEGRPAISVITVTANRGSQSFFIKLRKRLRHRGGIEATAATLQMLCDRKDYYGFFLYLTFLYGFLEWQVPERLTLLPASWGSLKCYCTEFMAALNRFVSSITDKEFTDDEDQEDI